MVKNLVTVVIVNYNSGEMLLKCIKQVLASTVPVKIIISDNASSDDSLHLLTVAYRDNPNIHIHKNHANLGFSAANNAVYPMIETPFILYLNPDCFINENTIEHLLQVMNNYPDAGMAGCLVTNPDGTEQAGCRGLTPSPARVFNQMCKLGKIFPDNSKFSGYLLSDKPLPDHPIEVELISGSCMFVRKKTIDDIGLLDAKYFLYCEDYDWFYRVIQGGWKIIFTPQTKVTHIKSYSTQQIPIRVLRYKAKGMWRYHNKFFKNDSSFFSTLLVRVGILSRLFVLSNICLSKKIWAIINKSIKLCAKE
ncbi:TPA: glycosyltransferase family 2 protein [Legionella pneumophila]|uniref:glycosyltransferase family 2 protein n=1 Tax=Legionella sp. PATHC039 TaxID=2992042 RepID=UPI001A17FEB8|nr:glycosyltransferase family 2 protein [Legionella sp. PATHC039]BCL64432.1 glycosyl transferase [Legionella pneumophila serogroup 7]HAT8858995.1 glycosyltransferase [Legionella pneumophila subsp. pneumophila]HAU1397536.1 glycosyltransferase family 2 protein [Legionella pneumophila]MCW8395601.1 glycosyltransferase family 2 protein [Legionella sp. PATHC039]HAT9650728.1 glycosyltransferase [Legionella pneumophila subsp. pneumophila]